MYLFNTHIALDTYNMLIKDNDVHRIITCICSSKPGNNVNIHYHNHNIQYQYKGPVL